MKTPQAFYMINKNGIPHLIPNKDIKKHIKQGARVAQEADFNYSIGDTSFFRIPWIEGVQYKKLKDCPILIQGAGPSAQATLPYAYVIAINPRKGHPIPNAIIALDDIYWNTIFPYDYKLLEQRALFYPSHCCGPKRGGQAFHLPIPALQNSVNNRIEIRTQSGVQNCNITAVAAVLLGKYLSNGPIIITGVDLSGNDRKGQSYKQRQEPIWRIVSSLFKKVYSHDALEGPLTSLFPRWPATTL